MQACRPGAGMPSLCQQLASPRLNIKLPVTTAQVNRRLPPCHVSPLGYDDLPSLSSEEQQLRAAIAAVKHSPGNRVISSLTQLTKAHSDFIRQHAIPVPTPGARPTHSLLSPLHIQGMAQQCDHVTHILQQQGTGGSMQLSAKDLALLGQACRRLRLVVLHEPALTPHQDALFTELVAAALRSPALAQADLLAWATLLHGLAAAGLKTPDMHRLLGSAVVHIPTTGALVAGILPTSRSRACARLLWAFVVCEYQGDVSSLLAYLVDAISEHGFMSTASPTHWSQLLWSAAKLNAPKEQLISLLKQGVPALCNLVESGEIQVNATVMSTTTWAAAQAGVPREAYTDLGLDRWLVIVQRAVAADVMRNAIVDETEQLSEALTKLGVTLATPGAAATEPAPPQQAAAGEPAKEAPQAAGAAA